jgi:MHS family proline/betaine transporter-like MFS transporter
MLNKKRLSLRLAFKTSLMGNTLEWYDYSNYGYLIPIIHHIFFPNLSIHSAIIQAFLIYGIGQTTRPLGGILFGFIADRWGRRTSLLCSIIIMTIPILIISLMPDYLQIGAIAMYIFVAMRAVQGISAGGELPVIAIYLVESSHKQDRGYLGGFTFFGCFFGLFLALIEYSLISFNVSEETMYHWGWRIPFIFGVMLGGISYYLRRGLSETALYREIEHRAAINKDPLLKLLQCSKKALVNMFGLSCLASVSFNLVLVASKVYLIHYMKLPIKRVLTLDFLMLILLLVLTPVMGRLGDRWGHRKLAWYFSLGFIIFSYPLYSFFHFGVVAQFLAIVGFAILISGYYSVLPVLFCDLFPTSVRASGIAIGNNLAVVILGGFSPVAVSYLIERYNDTNFPAYFLIGSAVISMCSLISLKKQRMYLTVEQ